MLPLPPPRTCAGEVLFMVLELCSGGSLKNLVCRQLARPDAVLYTWGDRVRWALQIAQGMADVERAKIWHKDLKLDNVLLTDKVNSTARVKIADFGLASRIREKRAAPGGGAHGGSSSADEPSADVVNAKVLNFKSTLLRVTSVKAPRGGGPAPPSPSAGTRGVLGAKIVTPQLHTPIQTPSLESVDDLGNGNGNGNGASAAAPGNGPSLGGPQMSLPGQPSTLDVSSSGVRVQEILGDKFSAGDDSAERGGGTFERPPVPLTNSGRRLGVAGLTKAMTTNSRNLAPSIRSARVDMETLAEGPHMSPKSESTQLRSPKGLRFAALPGGGTDDDASKNESNASATTSKKSSAFRSFGRAMSRALRLAPRPADEVPDDLSEFAGTLLYTAPEVLVNQKSGSKGDAFSYGVCLYELMYGTPFSVKYQNEMQVDEHVRRILAGWRPELNYSKWHPELCGLVSRCWAQLPEDRPCFTEIVECLTTHGGSIEEHMAKASDTSPGPSPDQDAIRFYAGLYMSWIMNNLSLQLMLQISFNSTTSVLFILIFTNILLTSCEKQADVRRLRLRDFVVRLHTAACTWTISFRSLGLTALDTASLSASSLKQPQAKEIFNFMYSSMTSVPDHHDSFFRFLILFFKVLLFVRFAP